MLELTPIQARRLALISQGLHRAHPFGRGKVAVESCLDALGYIQIDTISVIERSHHHCFWTRVPGYETKLLDDLQRERKILEYWAHAAAYLPMRDYRFCLPYMRAVASGQKHWRTRDPQLMRAVLKRVVAEGPLRSQDFEASAKKGTQWGWNWKPAKIALEQLFIEGKLIVSHREGFQKVYDLPERVLPPGLDTRLPSAAELRRHLIMRAIRAHGLVRDSEVAYLRKGLRSPVAEQLRCMEEEGEIVALRLATAPGLYYSTEEALQRLTKTRWKAQSVSLLSPFDNLVIQRKRVSELFGYDYQLECFLPESRRLYGYFCLPILYGDQFVGRLDPKAERRSGELIVRSLNLERPNGDVDTFAVLLARKLEQMAAFNSCAGIRLGEVSHSRLKRCLRAELSQRGVLMR